MTPSPSQHPKAYTVAEGIDGVWYYYTKDGDARTAGEKRGTFSGAGGYWINNTKEFAEYLAAECKKRDDFDTWREIAGSLSDEAFIQGARRYDVFIRSKEHLQNWLRDELLMRLILKKL